MKKPPCFNLFLSDHALIEEDVRRSGGIQAVDGIYEPRPGSL